MNREQFKAICRKTQNELKSYVVTKLKKKYDDLYIHKDFVYAKGTVPICLVAHLDTVHAEVPQVFVEEEDKISSPQGIGGDDRCGVYAILQIIQKHSCSVLFCCDEEIGGVGASVFSQSSLAKQAEFQYMIELDRKGKTDAVFYDCDNPKFTDFITDFGPWTENFGTFSDISYLAPAVGCAAVNLSVGYYNQHTLKEYVVPSEVDYCIDSVCRLIEATTDKDVYEYIEAEYEPYYYGYKGYGSGSSRYYYDDEDTYLVQWEDEDGKMHYEELEARSQLEAVGKFMVSHEDVPFRKVFDVLNESAYAYDMR